MAARRIRSVRLVLIVLSVALMVLLVFTSAEFPAVVAPLLALAWLLIANLTLRHHYAAIAYSRNGEPRAPPALS